MSAFHDDGPGIGIIGCGTIAGKMLAAWVPHMRNARLVAVSDVNPAQTELFQSTYGIPRAHADYRALLDDREVDAVLVLTPNFLHAEQTIAACAAGKHVCVQKPMSLTTAEAVDMIRAAETAGVTLMAGFLKRFWPYYVAIRKLLDDGALGELLTIRTQFSHSGIGKYYKPASDWFNDPAKAGGGPLADLGVHHFDVMRWLAGSDVARVSADIARLGPEGVLENNATVSLRFANGVMGQGYYSFTTVAPPGVTIERLEVYGTTGTALVTLAHPGRVVVQYCAEVGAAATYPGWIDLPVPEPVPAFGLMLQHFVDCLIAGRAPVTTGIDGYRTVEISESAYVSAREGRHVEIDLARRIA